MRQNTKQLEGAHESAYLRKVIKKISEVK